MTRFHFSISTLVAIGLEQPNVIYGVHALLSYSPPSQPFTVNQTFYQDDACFCHEYE